MDRLFENSPKHWSMDFNKIEESSGGDYSFDIYDLRLKNVKIVDIVDHNGIQNAEFEAEVVPDYYDWYYHGADADISSIEGEFTYIHNGEEETGHVGSIKVSGKVKGTCFDADSATRWTEDEFINEISYDAYDICIPLKKDLYYGKGPISSLMKAESKDLDISDDNLGYKVAYINAVTLNLPAADLNFNINLVEQGVDDIEESQHRSMLDIANDLEAASLNESAEKIVLSKLIDTPYFEVYQSLCNKLGKDAANEKIVDAMDVEDLKKILFDLGQKYRIVSGTPDDFITREVRYGALFDSKHKSMKDIANTLKESEMSSRNFKHKSMRDIAKDFGEDKFKEYTVSDCIDDIDEESQKAAQLGDYADKVGNQAMAQSAGGRVAALEDAKDLVNKIDKVSEDGYEQLMSN